MGLKPPIGTRDIDSTPAQTYASPAPIAIEPAAVCTACIDEPQKRLMVDPATVRGSPASTPTSRPAFMPCSPSGKAQPSVTSSMASGSTPVRSTSASTTRPASSSGRTPASAPFFAKWNGDRAYPAMTTRPLAAMAPPRWIPRDGQPSPCVGAAMRPV